MTEADLIRRAEATTQAWNRHDIEAVVAAFSPDARFRDVASGTLLLGRDAIRAEARSLLASLPDLELEVRRTLAAGGVVSQEWIARGTHCGALMGMPASGRRVEQDGVALADYDSAGRIAVFTRYWNVNNLLGQLR
jgi:steroid delta-isomerase-like uncharacterized protein